jgi:muconolactone delta-isomerase
MNRQHNFLIYMSTRIPSEMPVTVVERYKGLADAGTVGSNPTQGMDV